MWELRYHYIDETITYLHSLSTPTPESNSDPYQTPNSLRHVQASSQETQNADKAPRSSPTPPPPASSLVTSSRLEEYEKRRKKSNAQQRQFSYTGGVKENYEAVQSGWCPLFYRLLSKS